MLLVVILTLIFIIAVTPVLSDQRGRAGRARSESAVPVLCSGFLWEGGCADSNYCKVSSYSFFLVFLIALSAVFGFYVFISLSAVVDYLMRWFGFERCLDKCYFHPTMMI